MPVYIDHKNKNPKLYGQFLCQIEDCRYTDSFHGINIERNKLKDIYDIQRATRMANEIKPNFLIQVPWSEYTRSCGLHLQKRSTLNTV